MRVALRIRNFVDWDIATSGTTGGNASLFLLLLLWFLAGVVYSSFADPVATGAIVVGLMMTGVWLVFVAWRAWRLLKASSLEEDRKRDHKKR